MANPSGKQLPQHVVDYLTSCGVDPADLKGAVRDTYADLTVGEIKVLEKTGAVLKQSDLGEVKIAAIH